MVALPLMITRLLKAVAARAFPVLPWTYLAFRRATIPTLFTALVAIAFVLLDQSVEVLRSFTADPEPTWTVLMPTIAYLLTSIGAAIAIWYSARLLCTVEVAAALPDALRRKPGDRHHGAARLAVATKWYPRLLGSTALACAMGSLIYASYLLEAGAGYFAIAAMAGPLLLAAGYLLPRFRMLFAAAGLIAVVATLVLMFGVYDASAYRTACSIVAALLPAMLLVGFDRRRHWYHRLSGKPVAKATTRLDIGNVLSQLLLILAASVVGLAGMAMAPSVVIRAFGSASIVLCFLSAATFALTLGQLLLRACASQVSGFSTAILLAGAVLVFTMHQEPLGHERMEEKARATGASSEPVPSPATGPIVVNAYGGGLRAAIYTAEVLAQADDATCGVFGTRVRAFSGVSGGSLGIAVYLTLRQEIGKEALWRGCAAGTPTDRLTQAVRDTLRRDHLSALLSRMLGHDVLLVAGDPQRGQALMDSWQDAIVDTLKGRGVAHPRGLARPMSSLTGGLPLAPLVYFNSANVENGQIVPLANRFASRLLAPFADIRVGEAVLHSARFPFVTPAGEGLVRRQRLIDGGYADNSGARTLLRSKLVALSKDDYVVNINGNLQQKGADSGPAQEKKKQDDPELEVRRSLPVLSKAPTPLAALFSSRVARATDAIIDISDTTDGKRNDVIFTLGDEPDEKAGENVGGKVDDKVSATVDANVDARHDANKRKTECSVVKLQESAPLGWYTGTGSAEMLARSAGKGVRDIICRLPEVRCDNPPVVPAPCSEPAPASRTPAST